MFIVSATTNSAAAQVQGDKIHSIAGLRDYHFFRGGQINWISAKFLFDDVISMMDMMDFQKLDNFLRHLMA